MRRLGLVLVVLLAMLASCGDPCFDGIGGQGTCAVPTFVPGPSGGGGGSGFGAR